MKKIAKWCLRLLPWFGMAYFGYHLFMKELEDAVGEKSANSAQRLLEKNTKLKEYIKARPSFSSDKDALNAVSIVSPISDNKCLKWNNTLLGLVSFDEDNQIEKFCNSTIINCECFETPRVTRSEKH